MSLAFLRPFSGPCQTSHCPLSRLQARSTFFFHILSPSFIVATWPLRTPRAVSLFIRVNEVESRRSIEGTTINEHLCKFYQPLFPIRVRDIISPASIYFISSFSKHVYPSYPLDSPGKSIWIRIGKYRKYIDTLNNFVKTVNLEGNLVW